MADPNTYTARSPRLDPLVPQNQTNPSKFYTHFLYKSIIVLVFLVILPFFHSQAPEFINQTLHNRSWEFLQLIFVGIAVSYGLFSKKNEETEKDYGSKFDNAQSYVSRLLQVSSVFDDEIENPIGSDDNSKVQTWSSQYYRGEPMVVVAPENSALEEQSGKKSSHMVEKPLLLPVRSLKPKVNEYNMTESLNKSISDLDYVNRPSSMLGSKRYSGNSNNSSKSRLGEFGGGKNMGLEGKGEEVLRSPIPWKSRSGRMELKEDGKSPPQFSLPPSIEDSELNRLDSLSFRSQFSDSSRSNSSSSSSSPKNLSPQHSFSSESQAKRVEDLARKKTYYKSSPPPPPPPPPPPTTPPPFLHRPPVRKSTTSGKYSELFPGREFKRSGRSVPEQFSWGETGETGDFLGRGNSGAEWNSLMGKSVRTMESNSMKGRGDTHKINGGNFPPVSNQTFSDFPKEEKNEFVEDYQDSESEEEEEEDDEFEEKPENEMISTNTASDAGPDVDKKADEFIAKFREQIRLQRIASIRKSTGQIPKNSVR